MGQLLRGHCPSCTSSRDLVEMFTQPDGRPASALAPLAELPARYDNPYSLYLHLRRPGGQLIRRIVTGELACSHEALDALDQFTRDTDHCLARTTNTQDRTVLARYARWNLMPLAHQCAEHDTDLTRYRREHLRRQLEAARLLLGYLAREASNWPTLPSREWTDG